MSEFNTHVAVTYPGGVTQTIDTIDSNMFADENGDSGFVSELEYIGINNCGVVMFHYRYDETLHNNNDNDANENIIDWNASPMDNLHNFNQKSELIEKAKQIKMIHSDDLIRENNWWNCVPNALYMLMREWVNTNNAIWYPIPRHNNNKEEGEAIARMYAVAQGKPIVLIEDTK